MPSAEILAEIDALQARHARALDRRDLAAWLACFSQKEASYRCVSRENEEQDLPLAMMMDDSYERLKDRVKMIAEVWAGTFEDYATRHFVQRLECTENAPGAYVVSSNFMVIYTAANRHSSILVAGSYEDEITIAGGEARFRSKKAVLDTVTTPRYLVYPV